MKRFFAVFLCVCVLLTSMHVTLAIGDPNIDGGGGGTTGGTHKNQWIVGDDGVRVTVVRESDRRTMTVPIDFSNRKAPASIYYFGYKSKIHYTSGQGLEINFGGSYVNSTPATPIPQVVSASGSVNIAAVKRYFSLEGTVKDICAKTGFEFDKLTNGEYIILLEPLVYITYGGIRFCMTATEAALYDRVVSGDLKIKLGNITHQNLPLGMFLERPELGFPAWSGPMSGFRSNEEIISQLGLGTVRFSGAPCCNHVPDCPCLEGHDDPENPNDCDCTEIHPGKPCGPDEPDCPCIPDDEIEGDGGGGHTGTKYYDYRTDTDVITTIEVKDTIGGDSGTSPDVNARVTFHINGNNYSVPWVCPPSDSTFVWVKWHTPKTPKTITISVTSSTGEVLTPTVIARVKTLEEITPPDPKPQDTHPGFTAPKPPVREKLTSTSWGEWIPRWNAKWRQESTGHRDSCSDKCESSHYKWVGRWEYDWRGYTGSMSAQVKVRPADEVPTATGSYGEYTMKSGYGLYIDVAALSNTTGRKEDITLAQNAVTVFPEFGYETYNRVLERYAPGHFEFKVNIYSYKGARSHYTPLWFPDNMKYRPQTVVFDVWTPGGQMYTAYEDSYINILGDAYDDWNVRPVQ